MILVFSTPTQREKQEKEMQFYSSFDIPKCMLKSHVDFVFKHVKIGLAKIESNYRDWCSSMVRPKLASEFEFPASIL